MSRSASPIRTTALRGSHLHLARMHATARLAVALSLTATAVALTPSLAAAEQDATGAVDETIVGSTASTLAADGHAFDVYADHVDIQMFSGRQTLDSANNLQTFFFTIPAGMELDETCTMNLLVSASEHIDDDLALTISLNGTVVQSIPVQKIGSDGTGWLVCNIPSQVFKVGATNSVTLALVLADASASNTSDASDVQDYEARFTSSDTSNWIEFDASSTMQMRVKSLPACTNATWYPLQFDSVLSDPKTSLSFITDGQTSSRNAALRIASAFGAQVPYQSAIDLSAAGSTEEANVLVGGISDWKGPFGNLDVARAGDGEGIVSTAGSVSYTSIPRLLVYAQDDQGLSLAADAASDPDAMAELEGTSAVISSFASTSSVTPEERADGTYQLSDFGYEDVTLQGSSGEIASFRLTQPGGVASGPGSTVTIEFSHSDNLDPAQAELTVYINDERVDSVSLSDANADAGSLTVSIPQAARTSPIIDMRVEVNNYTGDVDPTKSENAGSTTISSASSVHLAHSDESISPSLSRLFTFASTSGDEDGTVVVHADGFDDALLNLAMRIGQANLQAVDFELAEPSGTADERDRTHDLVYMGSASTIELPDEIAEALDAVPRSDGTYRTDLSLPLDTDDLADAVVFQTVPSPWDPARTVYVITYPEGAEDRACSVLCNGEILDALDGTISAVSADGTVLSCDTTSVHKTGSNEADSAQTLLKSLIGYLRSPVVIACGIGGLAAALIVAIFLLARHIYRMGRERGAAEAAANRAAQTAREDAAVHELREEADSDFGIGSFTFETAASDLELVEAKAQHETEHGTDAETTAEPDEAEQALEAEADAGADREPAPTAGAAAAGAPAAETEAEAEASARPEAESKDEPATELADPVSPSEPAPAVEPRKRKQVPGYYVYDD
ncbi:cellulose biosynthesis cyclic di-GMP-binding regulatory protein BcsB [Collinsella ihumii]|uniref:Cellulose biosynthesis cyclic di-GMP-binding regulatory protein BcsB n=1 Tax=Collinsella ihumii TaxID=1720204 RepID=A0AAW7JPC5_9ACTN|nr:cellulose biosynthesis cyclic di-GMP-binding regulatory protein BcsB [Collinsella ihumii]MDN0069389.1 cellulose biosynthesis cyclic di-GMP-binding regulatory protein BcsB [Collinsella ihumii]